jgi:hypothetical protein
MYRQSKLVAGVATEDALEDDGVEDASLHASWRDKAEIPQKKIDNRQADRFHGKSGTQEGTTTEILRNPNLLIKTPKN